MFPICSLPAIGFPIYGTVFVFRRPFLLCEKPLDSMCFGAFFMVNGEELDKESKIKLTSLQLRGIKEFPVWGF